MEKIENEVDRFNAVDLEKANSVGLMKRYDTKFVFHAEKLQSVLEYLRNDYGVLEINNKRIFLYQTLYYDTDDYYFYRQHHDKKLSRYKIRCRTYADTKKCYIEVKCKTNKKKTIKDRLLINNGMIRSNLLDEAVSFARDHVFGKDCENRVDNIKPALLVNYRRITLTNPRNHERITFDVDLTFSDGDHDLKMKNLVVAELKQSHLIMSSYFSRYLKNMNIFPVQFSKYCMGVILMGKSTRYNRFKENLLVLVKSGLIPPINKSICSMKGLLDV